MTVKNVIDSYKADTNYVINSMILKSYDDYGCTYKWLCTNDTNIAFRREVFIATEGTGTLEDRTVLKYVDIDTAV